jgi:hypothetical protein
LNGKFRDRLKEQARRKPIEFVGVIVVTFYTAFAGYQSCKIGEANRLTGRIVQSTVAASLSCAVGSSFSRSEAKMPLTGSFLLNCNNAGKLTAENVSASITITALSFPKNRALSSKTCEFGGDDVFIPGGEGHEWSCFSSAFLPDKEIQLISDGSEIVVGNVKVSYSDGTGQKVLRRFCQVEVNSSFLGGSPDAWRNCDVLPTLRAILKTSRKKEAQREKIK